MKYSELQPILQNLTNTKITVTAMGQVIGVSSQNMNFKIKEGKKEVPENEIKMFEAFYGVSLSDVTFNSNQVNITYRPDVYLSAGYGIEVLDERKENISLDARLFITDRGNKIDPKNCEIVSISGNSMAPEYRHGDKVIIDKNDTELSDGQIFAFRYKNQCFVKEINLLPDKIKCISLNKEYDPFYIETDDIKVLGRILPRIRL